MRRRRHWRPYPIDETCKLYLPFYQYGGEQTKIWDLSTSHNDGTITGAIPATYPMLQPVASGSVTQANMRISAVNGTGFVDFSAADLLTSYLNHLLVIKDSSGRVIQGYIKAAGTGETLGDEILSGGDMEGGAGNPWIPTDWSNFSLALGESDQDLVDFHSGLSSIHINTAAATRGIQRDFGQISGALYYSSNWLKRTAGNFKLDVYNGLGVGIWSIVLSSGYATWTQYPKYFVSTATGVGTNSCAIYSQGGAAEWRIDDLSIKQVLTSSATGVTIVSTKGGATFNWESKDADFNYNDSSGYTYTIYSVLGYTGLGWFGDGVDDRFAHTSLNLGTTHTLHYWLLYQGISGTIHGGAANYHGLRLTPTACGYNVGTTEVTVTHSAKFGEPVLFSIDRNGTSVDFYKNGVKIGTTQTLGANTAQVLTDLFRYSDGTSYWNGVLFDIVGFNINKGAQEIRAFFELTRRQYGV